MSIYLIACVFNTEMASHGDKIVLLSLADYAWDDGTRCYPSVERLARHCSMTTRSVHRCLRSLEHDGYIKREGNLSPVGTIMYYLNLSMLREPRLIGRSPDDTMSGGMTMLAQASNVVTPPDTMSPYPLVNNLENRNSEKEEKQKDSYQIPESIALALKFCSILGAAPLLRRPEYWKAQVFAFDIDLGAELGRIESWLAANPRRRPRDLGRFLHNWFKRASEEQR